MTKQNITEDQITELKKEVREILANDRHELLIKFPFIGNLAMRFDLIPVRDLRCRTACTDGKAIYFDLAFFESLSKQERVFVLAHELFHNVLLHLVRCQTRIPELFNIATDMEVNYLLERQNNGTLFKSPKNLCFPPRSMQGKSAEVIYEWLLRKAKQQKSNSGNSSDQSDGGNDGNGKHGNKTGKLEGQFDKHEYNANQENADSSVNSGNSNSCSNSEITDRWGKVGFDKDFKPSISKDYSEKMREAVISEAQRSVRIQGTMPAGLEDIIAQITKPQFNWKEELSKFVTTCYNGSRRWLPPSRRHVYNEVYLQSRRSEKLKCTVLLDTSGSCWADLPLFFGELVGLLKSFGGYECNVIQCDADVHSCEKYDESNPFPVDNIKKLDIKGCGGSDFRPAFKYIRENNIHTDVLIAMTDGYISVPENAPPYPLLWVLTNDHSEDFCNYGKKMIFKPNNDTYTNLSS